MRRLIAANPHDRKAFPPLIGGGEVNSGLTHAHHRRVIDFPDRPLRRTDPGAKWRDADENV